MSTLHAPHLAVLGDREALGWVLTEERIAFPEPRYQNQLRAFERGDTLYLYATRGCFKNPTRDKGRVIGRATLTGAMTRAPEPVVFGQRAMPYVAPIDVESLTEVGEGVDLSQLAERLSCFPKSKSWSVYLRRSVVPLSVDDGALLDHALAGIAGTRRSHLEGYQARARMGQGRG